jgi:hypothetical protein
MEPQLILIDVPTTMSAEDATTTLNEPVARGYYLRSVNTGETMRFLFARYATDNKCSEELQAMDITVANKRATATRIVQLLALQDISRTTTWVNKTLMELA